MVVNILGIVVPWFGFHILKSAVLAQMQPGDNLWVNEFYFIYLIGYILLASALEGWSNLSKNIQPLVQGLRFEPLLSGSKVSVLNFKTK